MTIPELSIKQHVLATMVSGVILVFGVISYFRIGSDLLPTIDFPIITVTTALPGANPEIIDASVTNLIEEAANRIPGVDHIDSTSTPGMSLVTVVFELKKDPDVGFNEVRSKISEILNKLPEDADPPIISKIETGAQPVMWIALQGDRTLQQLNQYARTEVKKKFQTVEGVGEVLIGGKRDRTIRIEVDLRRMAALGITTQDLVAALKREHLQLPGGFLTVNNFEHMIKLDQEYHDIHSMRKLVVGYRDQSPILLEDVAEVVDGMADNRGMAFINGKEGIGLGLVKISNASTVAIEQAVKKKLAEEIIPQLPPGLTMHISYNDADFINTSLNSLEDHILVGTLLASMVVLVFLLSWRSTLIVAAAIPISLLGAIAGIYFLGYTLNMFTMLGLLLLIGVVVDDAIVVLENIHRHLNEGEADPRKAAVEGANEVFFAILAATLSIVSVFAPVVLIGGMLAELFEAFSIVVVLGVLASFLVSITLTPMLCSRFLRADAAQRSRLVRTLESGFAGLTHAYSRLLNISLNWRWSVILVTLIVVVFGFSLVRNIGATFIPDVDSGRFMVNFKTPLGSSVEYTKSRIDQIHAILADYPELESRFLAVGISQSSQVNRGYSIVKLTPRDTRARSQHDLIQELGPRLSKIPGLQAFTSQLAMVQGARPEQLQFGLTGSSLEEVDRLSLLLFQRLKELPGVGDLDRDFQMDLPQLQLHIDRVRAASLGLTTADVAQSINALMGGMNVAMYNDDPGDGERYDVRLKAKDGQFSNPQDLDKIYLRSKTGELVRADTLASFSETLGPAVISRYNVRYTANFYSNPRVPLGEAIAMVKAQAKDMNLPSGYAVSLRRASKDFDETNSSVIVAFTLATLLLYMVLASQFNSFVQPIIIMVAQPLAIVGALFGLWITGETLNLYSMIGMILLIGLVAKNSILLVDFTNQLRKQGRAIDDALREACPIRMRPVLMTSATLILAMLPAALGFGVSNETNAPMAIAIVAGMASSTLLTLLVVPSVYSLVENGLQRMRNRVASGAGRANNGRQPTI